MSGKYYVWHIVFKKNTKANHLFWAFVKEGIIRADQLLLIWMGWHSGYDYCVSLSQKTQCCLENTNSAANSYRYTAKIVPVIKRK